MLIIVSLLWEKLGCSLWHFEQFKLPCWSYYESFWIDDELTLLMDYEDAFSISFINLCYFKFFMPATYSRASSEDKLSALAMPSSFKLSSE